MKENVDILKTLTENQMIGLLTLLKYTPLYCLAIKEYPVDSLLREEFLDGISALSETGLDMGRFFSSLGRDDIVEAVKLDRFKKYGAIPHTVISFIEECAVRTPYNEAIKLLRKERTNNLTWL